MSQLYSILCRKREGKSGPFSFRGHNGFSMRLLLILFFLFFSFSAVNPSTWYLGDLATRRGLVLVRVSTVDQSYTRPWIRAPGRSYYVVGLVVPKGIIVAGNDVKDAGLIEVLKFSSYQPVMARTIHIDMEANLALLTVDKPGFFLDLKPMPLGSDPNPGESVGGVKVDDSFNVYREDLTVTEITDTPDYGFTHLPSIFFRSQEPFSSGGILMGKGGVVGYIEYANKEKQGEATPSSIIGKFYKMAKKKDYPGFACHGFILSELVDPVEREYYGLSSSEGGALVTRVLPGTSAWGVLRENDILLSAGKTPVDQKGYYDSGKTGKQRIAMAILNDGDRIRDPGEKVNMRVVRDGKKISVAMTLQSYKGFAERVPWLVEGMPSYLVESGFVFMELNVPYLREAFGKTWQMSSGEFAYLYKAERFYEIPGDDRIVILSSVLPDEANRGMEGSSSTRLISVNGTPVKNLHQLHRIVSEQKGIAILEMSDKRKVYLDLDHRDRINARIRMRYGVPALYWDSPKHAGD